MCTLLHVWHFEWILFYKWKHACTTTSNCSSISFQVVQVLSAQVCGVCLLPAALNWCRLFTAALSSRGGAEKLDAEAWHRFERIFHRSAHTNIRVNTQKQPQNSKHTYIAAKYRYQSVMMTVRYAIISITGLIANKVCLCFCCTLSGALKAIENNL